MNILDSHFYNNLYITTVYLKGCRLNFYHNKSKLQSCEDIIQSNVTRIQSIFQILTKSEWETTTTIRLENYEYKQTICPLFFINASVDVLELVYLENTFYKNSMITFSNDTSNRELNSFIKRLFLRQMHINLDLNLLHPKVFQNLLRLSIGVGSLNSIDGEIFKHLKNLLSIEIYPFILRKINHKQGINWIRQMNHGMYANLSSLTPNDRSMNIIIMAPKDTFKRFYRIAKIFPNEDFCIYTDFPFNQLIIVYQFFDNFMLEVNTNLDSKVHFSCTFLWLVQYYDNYYDYFQKKKHKKEDSYIKFYLPFITQVLNLTVFKTRMECNFEERIRLCNKSNYQIKDIWDETDFFLLNKKFETAFKILLYVTAFLGLFTNAIIVIVILKKDNNDLFKGLKQYSYLQ